MSNPFELVESTVQGAFGLYGRFPIYFLGDSAPKPNKEQYYTSKFGTQVWDRITLKNEDANHLNYIDFDQTVVVQPAYTFPDSVLIETATLGKDMITTKIAGVNGTVKEEISLDDYEFTIRGAIINDENDDYPSKQVAQLQGAFKRPLECGVESKYLNNVLKVYNLVFTESSLTLLEGYGNVQPFELSCKSDNPIVFQLLKK